MFEGLGPHLDGGEGIEDEGNYSVVHVDGGRVVKALELRVFCTREWVAVVEGVGLQLARETRSVFLHARTFAFASGTTSTSVSVTFLEQQGREISR
jgi:hypothetical protein